MQIIAGPRPSRVIPIVSVASGLVIGAFLIAVAATVAYLTLATPFLAKVSTGGQLTASRVIVGVLAWTFALTAPVGFGLIGLLRIVDAVDAITNRGRPTPAVRMARALSDDIYGAAGVRLPDGRPVSELLIGPFGAAIISQMPPARSIRRQQAIWEQRGPDGRWHSIENPLDRAVRDAERVRRWFGADDRDFVVKVHAALVDPALSVERTSSCAVITPAQIPAWLASLPVQRGMNADRREHLARKVRDTFA